MAYQITDVTGDAALQTLNLTADAVVFLPEIFDGQSPATAVFAATLLTVVKLTNLHGLRPQIFGNPEKPLLVERRSFEWFAPSIFISALYLSQRPDAVSIALNMISTYLAKAFPGGKMADANSVHLTISFGVRRTGRMMKVKYHGSSDGLKDLNSVIGTMLNDNTKG